MFLFILFQAKTLWLTIACGGVFLNISFSFYVFIIT